MPYWIVPQWGDQSMFHLLRHWEPKSRNVRITETVYIVFSWYTLRRFLKNDPILPLHSYFLNQSALQTLKLFPNRMLSANIILSFL